MLVFAALSHTFVIGMETVEFGHVPIGGPTSAISTFVWLLALAYLYTEMTSDERGDGDLHPAAARRAADDPRVRARRREPLGGAEGPLFGIHVSSLLFAYASFALACVIGITYVLLFKEIKAKHLGIFYARLPSLQVLDRMNQRAIAIGWVFLTIGMIAGVVWTAQGRAYGQTTQFQAMSLQDPKIFVALVCWARLFVRGVRGPADWMGRPARGLPVGARLRHRPAQFRPDQLFRDQKPQILTMRRDSGL